MTPAILLAAALGGGLGLELKVLTPDVAAGGEVRLRADEAPVVGAPGVHTFTIEYLGLTSNPVVVRARQP